MSIDPFQIRRFPRHHPVRLLYTGYSRAIERWAWLNFGRYQIKVSPHTHAAAVFLDIEDSAVSSGQTSCLLEAVRETEQTPGGCVVEVGAYRGVTTSNLAAATARQVIAVDPFGGYGGAANDYKVFVSRTGRLSNVIHIRDTSGGAARNWIHPRPGFVFVDAVHDYVNTRHDAQVWGSLLLPGGLISFHDIDSRSFAGTRRAVYKLSKKWNVWSVCDNLVVLRKPLCRY